MKKLIMGVLTLLWVSMIILEGCSSSPKAKIFSFENPQKITITSISGEKIEVTDEDMMQQITDNITSIQFKRGESSVDTNGFGPIISWYNSDGDVIETISVMSNDTIIYNNYFWTAINGSIDMEVINAVFSTETSSLGGVTDDAAASSETQEQTGEEDWEDKALLEELADTFGILISLPENPNWIADSKYYLVDENNLRISYHDSIADADCTLLVSKNNNLNLPQAEYDETLNESWEGNTISSQHIVVKVQHENNDEKMVLATWEYNEYQFAIIGEDVKDSTPIPKVALYIIEKLD